MWIEGSVLSAVKHFGVFCRFVRSTAATTRRDVTDAPWWWRPPHRGATNRTRPARDYTTTLESMMDAGRRFKF